MNTETLEISGLAVTVLRKSIKNLHVGVYPPDGHVRVAAPASISLDAIRVAIATKMPWIKRKQQEFTGQPRQTVRHYISGETHFVFGQPRRLSVDETIQKRHKIELQGNDRILLQVPAGSSTTQRRNWMESWYRTELRRIARPRIQKWSNRLSIDQPYWGIRRMKTKWGSCNPTGNRIWLNFELSKKPLLTVDYVILHELAHFISPRHDKKFIHTLDMNMPAWRQVRADLNAFPLAAELESL